MRVPDDWEDISSPSDMDMDTDSSSAMDSIDDVFDTKADGDNEDYADALNTLSASDMKEPAEHSFGRVNRDGMSYTCTIGFKLRRRTLYQVGTPDPLLGSVNDVNREDSLPQKIYTQTYETAPPAQTAPSELAVEAIPSNSLAPVAFACKVCNNVPTSPAVTMCGHLFCHRCVPYRLIDSSWLTVSLLFVS